jgi:hypothetical protein
MELTAHADSQDLNETPDTLFLLGGPVGAGAQSDDRDPGLWRHGQFRPRSTGAGIFANRDPGRIRSN